MTDLYFELPTCAANLKRSDVCLRWDAIDACGKTRDIASNVTPGCSAFGITDVITDIQVLCRLTGNSG
ncbi:MAG: hypothetical protein QGG67_14900 [Gammaproteobacteria bacterium]|nr:hypothetical protein [Gammaproteobacteria bacterium]